MPIEDVDAQLAHHEVPESPDLDAWAPWEPWQVAERFAGIDTPWYVGGGWALDLFRGELTRPHGDIEVAVPLHRFDEFAERMTDHELYVAGDGAVRPLATAGGAYFEHFQTWVRDPRSGMWRLDIMREPHDGDTWICRRDRLLRRSYADIIATNPDGVPYLRPEYALLFKAKGARQKDEADLLGVLPLLADGDRRWLATTIASVYAADHPWLTFINA